MAIRNGRIVEIGSSVGRGARVIDLKGATVIPGLIDAHAHIYWTFSNPGYEARDIELARSIPELLKAITHRSKSVPAGQFISCNGGWNRSQLAEKRLPSLAELDAAAPNHPLWIVEMQTEDAWIDPKKHPPKPAVANTRGLAFFAKQGVKTDAKTGQLSWAESTAALMKVQTEDDRRRNLRDAIDYMAGHGLTMLHDFGDGAVRGGTLEDRYPYVIDLWRRQKLNMRFRLRTYGPGVEGLRAMMVNNINRLGDDVLRMNGFGEGIGGRTAEEFIAAGKVVAQYGWSAHVHSVTVNKPGDTAEHVFHVTGYQAVNAVHPLKDLRWSLAHGNYLTPELAQALKAMGVGVEGDAWQYTEPLASVPMGPPFRMLLDSGINLGGGSDCTGTAGANPWLTIAWMTTGRLNTGELGNPGQTISRTEALKVHTKGSAWHSFDDEHLGTLEVGKLADIAVLSDDALTVSDDDLRRITSTLTLQAGKVVYQKA
jgi:predicted amidohydrolase YtcJ